MARAVIFLPKTTLVFGDENDVLWNGAEKLVEMAVAQSDWLIFGISGKK